LAGHAHAFEWIRSAELPHTGIFVTGGGGQLSLRRSVLDPRRFDRHQRAYASLRRARVVECAVSGRGPAEGRETGPIYHYLRVEVTPEALIVRPVGVRRTLSGYRREEPMPAYHAPRLPDAPPPWYARRLEAVEIRRDQPPRAVWND
ncbi:MAG TPA: hypothetical protein VGX50_05515, partial [Longimicrobium sp.]|nr:hypothetical protein [Longimicrobium sp.]